MNKIGIIGAMELEVEELKSKMEVSQIVEKASMKFFEGTLNGKDVVIVQCGIGKVNAGMCVQILADLFGVDAVINTGVAGSLRAEINIGDIVVSKDACEHDMDVSPLGYEPGIIPQMKASFFEADRTLVETAMAVCREVNPDIEVYEGRVLSGDQFIPIQTLYLSIALVLRALPLRSTTIYITATTSVMTTAPLLRTEPLTTLWMLCRVSTQVNLPLVNSNLSLSAV